MTSSRPWTTIASTALLACAACDRVPDGTFRGEFTGGAQREWSGTAQFCGSANGTQVMLDPGRDGFGVMLMHGGPLNTRKLQLKDFGDGAGDAPAVMYVARPPRFPASANLWVTGGSMSITHSDSTRLAGSMELTFERVRKPAGDTAKPILATATLSARRAEYCPIPVQ